MTIGRFITITVIGGLSLAAGLSCSAQAQADNQLNLRIVPKECVSETISDGLSQQTYLSPEDCQELLNPQGEQPANTRAYPTASSDQSAAGRRASKPVNSDRPGVATSQSNSFWQPLSEVLGSADTILRSSSTPVLGVTLGVGIPILALYVDHSWQLGYTNKLRSHATKLRRRKSKG